MGPNFTSSSNGHQSYMPLPWSRANCSSLVEESFNVPTLFQNKAINAIPAHDSKFHWSCHFCSSQNYIFHIMNYLILAIISKCQIKQDFPNDRFSSKYSQKTSHSSPVRARYGVSFVSSKPDPYPTPVDVVVYLISAIMNRVIKRFYCTVHFTCTNWI